MGVDDSAGFRRLPCIKDVIDDVVHSDIVRGLRENDRAAAAHLVRVAVHHG